MRLIEKEKEIYDERLSREHFEAQMKENNDKILYMKVCNDSLAEKCKIIKNVTEEWKKYSSNILS